MYMRACKSSFILFIYSFCYIFKFSHCCFDICWLSISPSIHTQWCSTRGFFFVASAVSCYHRMENIVSDEEQTEKITQNSIALCMVSTSKCVNTDRVCRQTISSDRIYTVKILMRLFFGQKKKKYSFTKADNLICCANNNQSAATLLPIINMVFYMACACAYVHSHKNIFTTI